MITPEGEVGGVFPQLCLTSEPPPTEFLQAPFPLLDSEVFLMNDQECEAFFQTPQISITEYDAIKDDMICAGDITNQKSTCRVRENGSDTPQCSL